MWKSLTLKFKMVEIKLMKMSSSKAQVKINKLENKRKVRNCLIKISFQMIVANLMNKMEMKRLINLVKIKILDGIKM